MAKQQDKIGALWTRESRGAAGGNEYLKGEITIAGVKAEIVVFRNGYKQSDKYPSHIIYASTSRPAADDREPDPTDAEAERNGA